MDTPRALFFSFIQQVTCQVALEYGQSRSFLGRKTACFRLHKASRAYNRDNDVLSSPFALFSSLLSTFSTTTKKVILKDYTLLIRVSSRLIFFLCRRH